MDSGLVMTDHRVLAALGRLRQLTAGQSREIMGGVARYMKTSMQLRFRQQQGPDRQRWKPSERARKEGGQTLRDTSRLLRSLSINFGPTYAEAGTNVVYAAAHQFGVRETVRINAHRRLIGKRDADKGRVSVKSVMVKAHSKLMYLPARPFAGFSLADRAEILKILSDGIAELAEK